MLYEFINKEIKDKSAVEKILITHKHYPIYKGFRTFQNI